jgi:hypothetical protein
MEHLNFIIPKMLRKKLWSFYGGHFFSISLYSVKNDRNEEEHSLKHKIKYKNKVS